MNVLNILIQRQFIQLTMNNNTEYTWIVPCINMKTIDQDLIVVLYNYFFLFVEIFFDL